MLRILVIATLGWAAAAHAAEGSAELGAAIADRWCSHCHVAGGSGSDTAPPLAILAQGRDDAWLRTFLSKPHGAMPDFSLTTQEIDDLVAYLRTLR